MGCSSDGFRVWDSIGFRVWVLASAGVVRVGVCGAGEGSGLDWVRRNSRRVQVGSGMGVVARLRI